MDGWKGHNFPIDASKLRELKKKEALIMIPPTLHYFS